MDTTGFVKKQTLYLTVFMALVVGFVSGVVYTVYRTPATDGPRHAAPGQLEMAAALANLEQATRDNPDDARAWANLGNAYFDTEQPRKAIEAYHKSLELLPGDTNIMTDLGVMYFQDNQHHKAIEFFDAVLDINPEHEQARFNKGVVLLTGLNDRDQALAEWKILLQYHPMSAAPSGRMVGDLIHQLENTPPPN
jgi:cytochrome c-type biogenesis protein CcmH/NrfG